MLGHAGGVLEEEMPRLAEMSDEESSECGSEGTLGEEGEEYEEEESGEEEEEIWSGGGGGGMGGGVEEAAAEPTSRASPRVAAQRMAHVPVELHDAELEGDAFEVRAERTCQVGVQIQGRLKACSHVWREIGASPWVLDVVDNGYKLPLIDDALPPPHAGGGNHAGSNTYGDWLERAVGELVTMGALKPSAVRPRVISPLDVIPKADYHETDNPDRLRMVLDTRWLNEYQQKIKFKYDDLNNSREMFSEGDGLFSIDFTSGYYHVDVHPEHQCLLGIEVNGKWYVFASLPFGVRDACRAFTLMVRAPVEFLRRTRGTRVLPYIDDLLFDLPCGWSAAQQEAERDFIVALFRRLGWLVGDKSELDITTEKKMIGWIVDTVAMDVLAAAEARRASSRWSRRRSPTTCARGGASTPRRWRASRATSRRCRSPSGARLARAAAICTTACVTRRRRATGIARFGCRLRRCVRWTTGLSPSRWCRRRSFVGLSLRLRT